MKLDFVNKASGNDFLEIGSVFVVEDIDVITGDILYNFKLEIFSQP